MVKLRNKLKELINLFYRCLLPIVVPHKLIKAIPKYLGYFGDWVRYSKMANAEPLKLINAYPCLFEKTSNTEFHSHYLYHCIWAFKKIFESGVKYHVDIGSNIYFTAMLTAITRVTFIDIRPLKAKWENFDSIKGNILSMPYKTSSVASLSCLHVAEHNGLGRYGDTLDPLGTKKACQELSRILASGGNLFFAAPIGKPRVRFNLHRIHSTQQILDYFSGLKLVELSGVDDKGSFITNIDRVILDSCIYGCGLFWFTKK